LVAEIEGSGGSAAFKLTSLVDLESTREVVEWATLEGMIEAVPDEMVGHLAALAPAVRVAEPEELAAAIVFLATDDASFVHGVTLAVDGGRVAT
jgi:NAD(P)-dependent dehydrogenase (short-subunit alcohol dehydrogenase family)